MLELEPGFLLAAKTAVTTAVSLGLSVAAFVWCIHTWSATRSREKAELDLRKAELDLDKELPYIRFTFSLESWEVDGGFILMIEATAENKGKRLAACRLDHADLLTVARAQRDEQGDTLLEPCGQTQYLKLEDGEVKPWSMRIIAPGTAKTFPFMVFVESPGFYYVQAKLVMTPDNERVVRKRYESLPDKQLCWSGSKYFRVGKAAETSGL